MKKMNLFLSCGFIACATCILATPAMANDNIFGDLTTTPPPSSTEIQTKNVVTQTISVPGASQMQKQETLTTQSLQTSISSLEAAQTDLRSKLETAKSNYAAVSQEYNRIKQERAALKKIVNQTEKRIKSIEKSKQRVQKAIQIEL